MYECDYCEDDGYIGDGRTPCSRCKSETEIQYIRGAIKVKYYELEEASRNSVHDAIYDGTYSYEDCYIGEELIAKLFEFIPDDIINLALMWDWSDTEVRDKICRFIRDNYLELINKIKSEEQR